MYQPQLTTEIRDLAAGLLLVKATRNVVNYKILSSSKEVTFGEE